MKHLNSAVAQAAQSNPGHELVMSFGGQVFTGVVCIAAVGAIIYLLLFKGRGKSNGS